MPKQNTYRNEIDRKNEIKIKEILDELPYYVKNYINSRNNDTTSRSRLSYLYDLRKFMIWLKDSSSEYKERSLKEINVEIFNNIKSVDIEDFLNECKLSANSMNSNAGLARKFAAINMFFSYLYKSDFIASNPCEKVTKPKLPKSTEIIRLSPNEVATLLDAIEYGPPNMTERQQKYLEHTKERDLAMTTLMLGSGIRVSECVGLNLSDIKMDDCIISVDRKGNKRQRIPLSDETMEALKDYLKIRKNMKVEDKASEDAVFLSLQNKRMCVQAVENMVVKYALSIGLSDNITPHKLRKTYGTTLYKETGDIYLVAEALGHKCVDTTRKHYAAQDEENLINARNKVKLR